MPKYGIVVEDKIEYLAVVEAKNLLEAYSIAGDLDLSYATLTKISPVTIINSFEVKEGELEDQVIHGRYDDNEPWVKYKVTKDDS